MEPRGLGFRSFSHKDVWSFLGIHEIAVSYDFTVKTFVNQHLTGLMAFLVLCMCRILQQKQRTYNKKCMWILDLTVFEQHPHVVEEFKYWLGLIGSAITNVGPTARPDITDEPNFERDEAPASPILPVIHKR